jgi:hypothetical protein
VDGSRVDVNIAGQGLVNIECVTAGSYGTLPVVTGAATNGSREVTGMVDASMALREGHYVTLTGTGSTTTVFLVQKIVYTASVIDKVYLSVPFDGTTGAMTFQLSPPVWSLVSQPNASQTVATNAPFTLTPFVSPLETYHTGTLATSDKLVTLATTNAIEGYRFRINRTGGSTAGPWNLAIGSPLLKNLITNSWCEVVYDGAAWKLSAYGTL